MTEQRAIRVVGLNGSPHRDGNTATLIGWVLEGCAEAGAEVEWVHLVDHDVQHCRGCFTCLRTGVCPIEDDVPAIRERLLAADGLVVGSPVHAGNPSARLLTLVERLTLLHLYVGVFERQHTVGVATSGVAPTGDVAKLLATFFGRRCGVIGAKTASAANGYRPLADVHNSRLPQRARALGRVLVAEIRSPSRLRFVPFEHVWMPILRRLVIRPMVLQNPEQFAGVLGAWRARGRTE